MKEIISAKVGSKSEVYVLDDLSIGSLSEMFLDQEKTLCTKTIIANDENGIANVTITIDLNKL